jgi:hypothetical protein
MEHRWNEIDREKPKNSGKNLSQCHFVHHKSYTDWPGIEPGPPRRQLTAWAMARPWSVSYFCSILIKTGLCQQNVEAIPKQKLQ